jgi:hypothetical protein
VPFYQKRAFDVTKALVFSNFMHSQHGVGECLICKIFKNAAIMLLHWRNTMLLLLLAIPLLGTVWALWRWYLVPKKKRLSTPSVKHPSADRKIWKTIVKVNNDE